MTQDFVQELIAANNYVGYLIYGTAISEADIAGKLHQRNFTRQTLVKGSIRIGEESGVTVNYDLRAARPFSVMLIEDTPTTRDAARILLTRIIDEVFEDV